MAFGGQSGRVFKVGFGHAQTLGFFVHLLDEHVHRASSHGFGKRGGGIVAGLDNHAFNQITHAGGDFGNEEHPRAFDFPACIGHGQHLVGAQCAVFQSLEREVGGHHFGQRSGFDLRVDIAGGKHLMAVQIGNDVGGSGNGRRHIGTVDAGHHGFGLRCGGRSRLGSGNCGSCVVFSRLRRGLRGGNHQRRDQYG